MKKVMTREELVKEIADMMVHDLNSVIVEQYREVLIAGYEGLENMPDSELIEEYAYYKDYQTEDIEIKDVEVLRGTIDAGMYLYSKVMDKDTILHFATTMSNTGDSSFLKEMLKSDPRVISVDCGVYRILKD